MIMSENTITEGFAPFREYETWYRITGDVHSGVTPLVVAHGGPGCSHDYLDSLVALARSGRAVIHYDQLGRRAFDPVAQSRGGLLDGRSCSWTSSITCSTHWASKATTTYSASPGAACWAPSTRFVDLKGYEGSFLSNSPASMELWASEAKILRGQLPRDVEAALDRHEADGTINDPEYLDATKVYYDEHVCRVVPNPPEVVRSFEYMAKDSTVYNTMNGPNEFFCIGTLRDWSVVDRVSAIAVPTLLLSGRHDEATPATVQPFFENIPDVRHWEIFEESSHMPFVEETDRYMDVVDEFLVSLD